MHTNAYMHTYSIHKLWLYTVCVFRHSHIGTHIDAFSCIDKRTLHLQDWRLDLLLFFPWLKIMKFGLFLKKWRSKHMLMEFVEIRKYKYIKIFKLWAKTPGKHSWLQCLNQQKSWELNDFWRLCAAHMLTYTYTYTHTHTHTHIQSF